MKEEFRNTTWACKDCVRLNEVQQELRLAQNVKGNKSSYCCYDSNERSNRENISLLLNRAGDLVPADRRPPLFQSSPTRSQRHLVFIKGVQELPAVAGLSQG